MLVGAVWEGGKWGELVFTDEIGGPPASFHVTGRFRAPLRLAGLAAIRYHDLRHATASLMAAQGIPPRVAVGHAQISTTKNTYSHVVPELYRQAAERMAETLLA